MLIYALAKSTEGGWNFKPVFRVYVGHPHIAGRGGRATFALTYEVGGERPQSLGCAFLSPQDHFDRRRGIHIAVGRALAAVGYWNLHKVRLDPFTVQNIERDNPDIKHGFPTNVTGAVSIWTAVPKYMDSDIPGEKILVRKLYEPNENDFNLIRDTDTRLQEYAQIFAL